MEKTIIIDGKEVRFKASGGAAYRYKSQFGREMFADAAQMQDLINSATVKKITQKRADGKLEVKEVTEYDVTKASLTAIYNLLWVYAKTADESIPDPQTWLDSFDNFPVMSIFEQFADITSQNFAVDRKNA